MAEFAIAPIVHGLRAGVRAGRQSQDYGGVQENRCSRRPQALSRSGMKAGIFRGGLSLLALALSVPAVWAAGAPSAPARNTYVIVHGMWGGGWAFREVDRRLTADGHKVYRPTLTGLGEKVHLASPAIDLTTHITDIVNVILWEDLHDVVLVGHSYGGAVITGVADRVPERIKSIIYLDAGILRDGECFAETLPGGIPGQVVAGLVPPSWVTPDQPLPHDVPHPAKTLTEKIRLTRQASVGRIPTTYVLFVAPKETIETAWFYPFYLRAKERGWKLRTLGSDHNAQWSHPAELVEVLEDAAAADR